MVNFSYTEDLYSWNEAVFNGKILSEESLKAAFTTVKLNKDDLPSDNGKVIKAIYRQGGMKFEAPKIK